MRYLDGATSAIPTHFINTLARGCLCPRKMRMIKVAYECYFQLGACPSGIGPDPAVVRVIRNKRPGLRWWHRRPRSGRGRFDQDRGSTERRTSAVQEHREQDRVIKNDIPEINEAASLAASFLFGVCSPASKRRFDLLRAKIEVRERHRNPLGRRDRNIGGVSLFSKRQLVPPGG